jgi:hypothetical protein
VPQDFGHCIACGDHLPQVLQWSDTSKIVEQCSIPPDSSGTHVFALVGNSAIELRIKGLRTRRIAPNGA